MLTDRVDWRDGKPGLAGCPERELDCGAAGEPAIVLSLFFAVSAKDPSLEVLVVVVCGLAVREELLDDGCRAVEAGLGLVADLAVVGGMPRLVTGFLSLAAGGPGFGRFSNGAAADLGIVGLEDVLGAIDILLAEPLVMVFLFSSIVPERGFGLSSAELRDSLDLCPALAAVAALTACAGLLGAAPAAGRVGGLLRLLPETAREVEVVGWVAAAVGAAPRGRFAVVAGRLGGMPLLRGDLGEPTLLSFAEGELTGVADCFLSGGASSAGPLSTWTSPSVSAMMSEVGAGA